MIDGPTAANGPANHPAVANVPDHIFDIRAATVRERNASTIEDPDSFAPIDQ
jgi:hypothetical protein